MVKIENGKWKMVQDRGIVTTADQCKVVSTNRHHFQWPWTTPKTDFKVTPILDVEYGINLTVHDRHKFTSTMDNQKELTRSTHRCNFESSWMTLSDLQNV